MSTCEKCGASFDPKLTPLEVTTTRILCPPCHAARAAEKARAKSGASAPPPANVVLKPAPAPVAVPAKVPPTAPAARPAPAPSKAAVSAAAPPAPAPKRVEAPPPPKPSAPKPAPVAKSAPPSPKRAKGAKPARVSELDTDELKKKKNRGIIIGYVISLVGMVVAGGVVYVVLNKKHVEAETIAAAQKRVSDFMKTFNEMDISTEDNANAAVKFADENRSIWENNDEIATDAQNRYARAATNAKLFKERRLLDAQIVGIEKSFAAPDTLTSEQVTSARRELEDIEPRVASSAEMLARVAKLRASVDQLYADRLFQEARVAAQGEASLETLAKFQRAEDELRAALEKAKKDKNAEQVAVFEPLYKDVIRESDEVVAKLFTPEAIEKAPWRDLLADSEKTNWMAPAAKGFEWRLNNGAMQIVGPDADAIGIPILSIGDKEKWCDFVGEMECTIERGTTLLYFRLGIGGNATTQAIKPQELSTEGNHALTKGEPIKVAFKCVGSDYFFSIEGLEPDTTPIGWTRVRKGALAFEFDPKTKTEMRIDKLRVKVLRVAD